MPHSTKTLAVKTDKHLITRNNLSGIYYFCIKKSLPTIYGYEHKPTIETYYGQSEIF